MMMQAHVQSTDDLMTCFQQWGWIEGLRARGPETVFVTDADIAAVLDTAIGTQACKIAHLDEYKTISLAGVTEVIFFCREKERLHARRFAARHSDITVASATYDYLPSGIMHARFARASTVATPVKVINLIIAAPAAGAEDLMALLEDNKVCKVQKIISHTLLYWVSQQTDFNFLRYLKAIGDQHSDTKLDVFVETDVLTAIMERTQLSWSFLFPKEPVIPMNVLYFMRRAKIAQAYDLARMRGMPDALYLGLDKKSINVVKNVPPSAVDAWVEALLRLEVAIETTMSPLKKMKNITAEDLYGAPDNVLPDASDFFKRGVRKKRDYSAIFKAIDDAVSNEPQVKEHTRRLIDSLGLVVSDQGSFTSITNKLLRSL